MLNQYTLTDTMKITDSHLRAVGAAALFLFFYISFANAGIVFGQNVKYTQGNADSALQSSLEVNPSTLGMSIQVPLASYPGRGGGLPVILRYSSKQWRIGFSDTFKQGTVNKTRTEGNWAENSTAGWTSSLTLPVIEVPPDYRGPYTGLGRPICISGDCNPPPSPSETILYINRVLLRMPDGSSHELRKDDSTTYNSNADLGVYYAADSSNIRFETATNTIFMPDGSRYLLSVSAGTQAQYIDRNGNTLTYTFSSNQWTDALGRNIAFPLSNSSWGDVTNSLTGVNGGTLNYTLRWRYLHESLSSGSVRVIGDYDYTNGNDPQPHNVPSLFTYFQLSGVKRDYVVSDGPPFSSNYFDPIVLKEIVLPNGKSYTFTYNVFGEIDKVTYPTGGYERFAHGIVPGLSGSMDSFVYNQANRGVTDRWVSVTGDGTDEAQQHWTYSVGGPTYFTRVTDPTGVISERSLHTTSVYQNFGFDDARSGMAYEERTYSAGGQMIRRTLTEWTTSGANPPDPSGLIGATRNPRVTKQVEILLDTGGNALAKTTTMSYDNDLNVIATNQYDYVSISQSTGQTGAIGAIPLGTLLRTEETTFLVNDSSISSTIRDAYRARNLLALPTETRIKNGSGTVVAATRISYDEAGYPLLTYGSMTGWIDPATTVRGNATTTQSWLNFNGTTWFTYPSGSWLVTHAQYDQCGNLRKSWDANGNLSQVTYTDSFSGGTPPGATYAYPTQTTSPTVGGTTLTTSTIYDYRTGKPTSATDPNNQVTTTEYSDVLNRPTRTVQAVGVIGVQSQTTINYDDTNRKITTTSDRDTYNDNLIKSEAVYDGLGRTVETRKYETSSTYSSVSQIYDAVGRTSQVSNPYRSGDTVVWTTTAYDALSRVISVTTPDTAHIDTAYSGNRIMVTDQASKKRLSETDALGHLSKVWEIKGADSETVSITFPTGGTTYNGYLTQYSYDTLDNLTTVAQGVQTRTFVYDSVKRLTSATNPESGQITYQHDANGNLTSKTDARSVTTTYAYDALNRNTTVNYSNTPTRNPDISRYYDGATNGKGRFWYDYAGDDPTSGQTVDHVAVDSYDALGRPLAQRQLFKSSGVWSSAYSVNRTYDLAGDLKSQTYPSGHTVNYGYDQAGRINSFSGNLGSGSPSSYATDIRYNSYGLMSRETYGTLSGSLYRNLHYNNRMQMVELHLGNDPNNEYEYSRGALVFYYGTAAKTAGNPHTNSPDNNGNVLQQVNYVQISGGVTVIPQIDVYNYDDLNRISGMTESQRDASGTTINNVVTQNYGYDRYGNRQITGSSGGGSSYNPTYNLSNNRISGLGYDSAGNITSDPLTGGTMTYDAENRMLTGTNGGGGSYIYNANGKRVRRVTAGQERWYVYGPSGELVAEYNANGAAGSPKREYGYRGGQLLVTADSGSSANLALGRTATQSSTSAGALASRAVDGNTDGNFASNSVSHTNLDHQPWWQVDLGSVQQIGTVRLWNRTDCCEERLANFYVFVSDTAFSSIDLATTISQMGVSSYYTSGPVGAGTELPIYRSGRYVRVQLAGDNYLHLAEVEVYGGNGVQWLVTDHLGSTRMVVDQTGSQSGVKRQDYLPFGEELTAGIRATGYGYIGSNVRQKFGSKERDNETGLDYFIARYHSSLQGRFISVDPENAGADQEDPQSWNGYAYARSSPLLYSDPDGRKFLVCGPSGGSSCNFVSDEDFYSDQRNLKRAGLFFTGNGDFYESGSILFNGQVQATYQQIDIDDPHKRVIFEFRMAFGDPAIYRNAGINSVLGAIIFNRNQLRFPRGNLSTIDRLSRAAAAADREGYTKAGRSLSKHGLGARQGNSKFPPAAGNTQAKNKLAQDLVDDILTNPGTKITAGYRPRWGNTIEVVAPDGRGLVYKASGEFLFFKE